VHPKTSIVYEYPTSEGDPYYPIPQPQNAELYAKYKALADAVPDVHFAGRLATYKYYNMDQVAGQALSLFEKIAARDTKYGSLQREQSLVEDSMLRVKNPNALPSGPGKGKAA
jgi:UDP-galactopyranose mutase